MKVLDKSGAYFEFICKTFLVLRKDKLKAEILSGPQIQRLNIDNAFEWDITMNEFAVSYFFAVAKMSTTRNFFK